MNENNAVIALKNGDRGAFRYLFNAYYDRLLAYITTYTQNRIQSEDIVQEAFIDFWNNKSKLDETKCPKNYLYAIAYNRYIDTVKKTKKQEKILRDVWEQALTNCIEEDSEAMERRVKRMKKIIESLPPKCREIIILNKMYGFKYKEIASIKGISIKTVESQMRIAFIKIREAKNGNDLILFLTWPHTNIIMYN
ncbi:RNA polymerase sigma-70 factor [Arenibacter sp. M-2]|uniref:RNA polymerase sigma factor n=1 Tax=unclassified Arenibacter TaxID=2615047 RepID=UPI000D7662A1|nr:MULTISPECIES: RNA polymerase sigma-70 factor [unclassified Arenibacter]MDL5510430.1 RNA polymerase sigma-70 factor [Arenibacter sp. M-2]PXX31300.1 RNA polymerase sigma-70 factor (ECF subfamily) [Arenibacter sp. ARW7G5Y1]|tara:strand:- start:7238 stop:7819 length:582 start_codon:yes stop_codon:yes gene_type:complete